MKITSVSRSEERAGDNWNRSRREMAREITHLLHFQNQFIDRPCLRREFAAIPNRHRARDVRCITIPLATSIDKQHLRVDLLCFAVREPVLVLVVVGFDGAPREFTVVATVVESGCTRRGCYDREIGLVYGSCRRQREIELNTLDEDL